MNLTLAGHHIDLTPAIRDYLAAKLERVNRHFDHVIDISVVLSVDKLEHRVEANLHTRGKDIRAEAREPDMYAAIDALADMLDRAVLRHKETRIGQRHDGAQRKRDLAAQGGEAAPDDSDLPAGVSRPGSP
jgi:putative sigma-54 modulation protein